MRIDMTARDWAELVKPVLPHLVKDPEFPEFAQVRIEVGRTALYAVATDRYTMGVERRLLDKPDRYQPQPPVHVHLDDVQASLKLFRYSKEDNPSVSVTIDSVSVPVEVMGDRSRYSVMAVTLDGGDGKRLVMHDRRMQGRDPAEGWQKHLTAAMGRVQGGSISGIYLNPNHVGRWKDAVRAGERLTLWTGPERKDPILVTVDEHFAGVWMPFAWGAGENAAPQQPAALPWLDELRGDGGFDLRTASGLLVADTATGEKRAIGCCGHCDHDPDWEHEEPCKECAAG